MTLVHELEKLVDYCLQELPMCLQKSRILSDDVHNVRRDNRLVVLPSLDFTEAKKVLDDGDQKALLRFLVCEEDQREDWDVNEDSLIAPEIEPIAQHSVLRFCQDHSEPSTCFASFSVKMVSVSRTSRCVR